MFLIFRRGYKYYYNLSDLSRYLIMVIMVKTRNKGGNAVKW